MTATLLLCATLSLASVRAGERVPVQRPAENDSISAAGRELDSLKANATKDANTSGASALPHIAVPELQQAAEAPVPLPQPGDEADALKAKRSANWLVDAMMKPAQKKDSDRGRDASDRHRPPRRDGSPGAERADLADRTDDTSSPRELTSEPDRSHPADRGPNSSPTDQAFNPLARYMAGWLAPQDYALLRRTLDSSAATSSRAPEPTNSVPGLDPTSSGGELLAGLAGLDKPAAPVGATKAADNPYLEALSLPVVPPPLPASPPASAPPPDVSLAPQPQPAPEPARPIIPPFVRPVTDDKYFKPLKRF